MDNSNLPLTLANRMVIQSYLVTTSKFKFSVYEKRVLLRLIQLMQPMLEGQKLSGKITVDRDLFDETYLFNIPISLLSTDTHQDRFKEAVRELNKKSFEYVNEAGDWKIIRLIEMPKITKGGNVQFRLTSELVNVFLDFSKGYSKFNSNISLNLKSVYSMRFYELMSNQKRPLTFKVETLREMFKLGDKYKLIGSFIQRIIEPSKKELDETSNWSFNYKPIKKGRKFEYIQFTPIHHPERENILDERKDLTKRLHLSSFFDREWRKIFKEIYGFTDRQIKNNLSTFQTFIRLPHIDPKERLEHFWTYAKNMSNPKGYLINSMKQEIESFKQTVGDNSLFG